MLRVLVHDRNVLVHQTAHSGPMMHLVVLLHAATSLLLEDKKDLFFFCTSNLGINSLSDHSLPDHITHQHCYRLTLNYFKVKLR